MRVMHLSDLHLGKKISGISLEEDQQYILQEIIKIAEAEKVEAIIIAGDVYDKALPSISAINLLDEFLAQVQALNIPLLIIAGNHDSADRLAYGHRLFASQKIYLSPVYHGSVNKITLQDDYGNLNFYLLPFLKPALVRGFAEDKEINTYDDAIAFALEPSLATLPTQERNILIAHQFVTGGQTSESEELLVGGLDNVSAKLFQAFDYVALGHLHTPQQVGKENIRYCGTPLKYSLSECNQEKSVTICDFGAKGDLKINTIPLKPQRDLRKIVGTYEDITFRGNYEHTNLQDLVGIVLKDEEEIPDAINRLRAIYPNILQLTYDNKRTRTDTKLILGKIKEESPLELFARFYESQNNQALTPEQIAVVEGILAREDN